MISNEILKKKILSMAFCGILVDNDLKLLKPNIGKIFEKNDDQIPKNWIVTSFDIIANIVNGFTPLRTNKSFWDKKEIPWFTIDDIRTQGEVINQTEQFITKKALGNSSNRLLPVNTILLCCTASVGECAITKIELTTNQQFNGIVIKENYIKDIYPKYIYWYCKTLKNKLIDNAGKTTINFVSTKKLGKMLVPIPPLEEQERIVNKIEELFDLIDKKEKNEQEIEKLKIILKEKILDSAIHGELVDNDLSLSPIDLDAIYEDIPFEIPSNWKWCKLKQISNYGSNRKIKGTEIGDESWILELEDIEKNTGNVISKIMQSQRHAVSDKNYFKKGNLLYGKLRPYLNKCVIADEDGYCCTEIEPMELHPDIEVKFLQRVLMSKYFLNYVNSCSYGAKMPRLGTKDGKESLIPVPPLEQQKKIAEKIEQCFELIEQL